jgi:hypothetical protein
MPPKDCFERTDRSRFKLGIGHKLDHHVLEDDADSGSSVVSSVSPVVARFRFF